jgi:hypothetical protein
MIMTSRHFRLILSCFFALLLLRSEAIAQFQIAPAQLDLVVAPEFDHTPVKVPVSETAAGFDFATLSASSSAAWVTPTIDTATGEVVLTLNTKGFVASNNLATVTVSGAGTSDSFTVRALVAPLKIVKLLDDPFRSRTYGIHQDGVNGGALVVIDPITNTKLGCVTLGKKPTDFAISPNGSELIAINSVDETISAVDLATLRVRETIALPTYENWGLPDTTADVAYGAGNIIYYTDGSWAPVMYVFDRSTKQVLQQLTDQLTNYDGGYGFGDFCLSPDGASLFAWAQYGWSAGVASSYAMKYSVNPNGTLTFSKRTNSSYRAGLDRDPLDAPMLIDSASDAVYAKQRALNPLLITDIERTFPSPVYAISPGGEIAITDAAIFETSTGISVFPLPVRTTVVAVTSDYARLVYFNNTDRTLNTVNLMSAIGPSILNRDLYPIDGANVLPPTALRWTPLPGVDSYRVYLGVSEQQVTDAGTDSALYLGEVNTSNFTFTTQLPQGVRYYWRVDAVNIAGVTKGDVYDFRVSTIGTDVTKINTATVRGHADLRVDVQLSGDGKQAWTASANEPWVHLASNTGTATDKLTVVLDASQLAVGVHTASVTLALSPGGITAFTLPISLEVEALSLTVMESDRQSSKIYAVSEDTGAVTKGHAYLLELDSATKAISRVVRVGTGVTDIAVHNGDGMVYVTNWMTGVLRAVDMTTFKEVRNYGFNSFEGTGYGENDVYRIAAGVAGRLVVEEEDQWIDIDIFDTVSGTKLASTFEREGGGEFATGGRFYYHGDNNSSGAEIHKYDVTGDVFTKLAHVRVQSWSYSGTRTVVVSEDGERVFWNGSMFNKNLAVLWTMNDEIYATSIDGRLAFSATNIYDTVRQVSVGTMPTTTKISAYNSATRRLALQVGTGVKFYDMDPDSPLVIPTLSATGTTSTSVSLSWTDDSLESGFWIQQRVAGTTAWLDSNPSIPANHTSYTVTGLLQNKTYEFQIRARFLTNDSAPSNIVSATTRAAALPIVSTGSASFSLSGHAVLNGTVNPKGVATDVYFEYGATDSYGNSTARQAADGTLVRSFAHSTGALSPNTTYHFRIVAITANGTVNGEDQTFTTGGTKPAIDIQSATAITNTTMTLRGFVNANGSSASAYFAYGATASLGQTTTPKNIEAGAGAVAITAPLSGLQPGTTYYYRLIATNDGGTAQSSIVTATTPGVGAGGLIAVNDIAFTARRAACVFDVLANDVGAPRSELRVTGISVPARGAAFSNANGIVTYVPNATFAGEDIFTYQLSDSAGHSTTGTVTIRDSFVELAGDYCALVGDEGTAFDNSGIIWITVTRNGRLTGVLEFAGERFGLATELRYDGIASFFIRRGTAREIFVSLRIDPSSHELNGSASSAAGVSRFNGRKAPNARNEPATQRGSYTMLLPPEIENGPQGFGTATMQIGADGKARIAGKTGVGRPFTAWSVVGGDARFPLYAELKRPHASIQGWLTFRTVEGISDFDGRVGWNAANGSTARNEMLGSRYTSPDQIASILPYSEAQCDFWYASSDVSAAIHSLTITPTIQSASPRKLFSFKVEPRTGRFNGTVMIAGKKAAYSGVVFQAQTIGAGSFKTSVGIGNIRLDRMSSGANNSSGNTLLIGR